MIFPSIENSYCIATVLTLWFYLITGLLDQLEEKESKRLHAAGERVLTRVRDEKNKLQDAQTQLGKELKDVQA